MDTTKVCQRNKVLKVNKLMPFWNTKGFVYISSYTFLWCNG